MYFCIDLKSFYASVECVIHGYDPFKTALVVADNERGGGAITLAVTPYLKEMGVKNRCRLYEIPKQILYICQKPRMSLYIEYSCLVYEIYLKYFSSDDIYTYSIDEVFIDISPYKNIYNMSYENLALMILDDIYNTLGLCATVGIGENMYLAKIAMDIIAKHNKSHIGYLDEEKYIKELSHHIPLTDFWQIGIGITNRLKKLGIYDMQGIRDAKEDILYKEFGKNARELIMHAYGKEDTNMKDVKSYKPKSKSFSIGQTLDSDYSYNQIYTVILEMLDEKCVLLSKEGINVGGIGLYIGYSNKYNVSPTGGSLKLDIISNKYSYLRYKLKELYEKTTIKNIPIRKVSINLFDLYFDGFSTTNLFMDVNKLKKEEDLYHTIAKIKNKYGNNSLFKAISLNKESTLRKRNTLIGGHNRE